MKWVLLFSKICTFSMVEAAACCVVIVLDESNTLSGFLLMYTSKRKGKFSFDL